MRDGPATRGVGSARPDVAPAHDAGSEPCQACGACCAYSAEWPRFTIEDDDALDRIPLQYSHPCGRGMRCVGDRCSALTGNIGISTACSVYDIRPQVCRDCLPGDPECGMARARFGLPPLLLPLERKLPSHKGVA